MNKLPLFDRIDAQLKIYYDLQATRPVVTVAFMTQAKQLMNDIETLAEELIHNVNSKTGASILYFLTESLLNTGEANSLRFIIGLMTIRPSYYITEKDYEYALKLLKVLDPYMKARTECVSREIRELIDQERPLKTKYDTSQSETSTVTNTPKPSEIKTDEKSNCMSCGSINPEKICSRCHIARYCNSTCQKTHWPTHNSNCTKQ